MLWRALRDIGQGFYIDVGANDPTIDSVTHAFYKKGWRGVNIEPVKQWHEKLKNERPRDINLLLAAGADFGELLLYELPDTGLSTSNKAFADRHHAEREYEIAPQMVNVKPLTAICHELGIKTVHFLKVDVEGGEAEVLSGVDFAQIRPWIILVEATLPDLPIQNYESWEPGLLAADYHFAYFDGLNRFYIANEHTNRLLPAFKLPPNIFDDFQRALEYQSIQHNHELIKELVEIYASISWKITKPLRILKRVAKKIFKRITILTKTT